MHRHLVDTAPTDQKQAEEVMPKMITAGASAYPRIIDFERMSQIAKSVNALLFVDMAHIAGLVAGEVHPSPIGHADFVSTTTHKSLRGPRGGLILCNEEWSKKIDSMVFPGVQGGPLMHVIAAKAACFGEALRPGFKEYQKEHIENAIFFDLEKHSNQQKNLPHNHFLPKKSDWEKTLSEMGISNDDKVVIYDNSDLITSCRCWFQFLYFGHRPDLVFILDGGLKKWKLENRKITNKETKIKPSKYFAKENTHMIKTKLQIEENIKKDEFKLLDARSKERFNGKVKEPRPGVRSGSIEGSICLPYSECINPKDNSFLNKKILDEKFKSLNVVDNNVVFSCGSSVTASVLGVAYSLINNKYMPIIYVGSWSEYGKK